MDDEHDDYREREERTEAEMRAESEDRAETEDLERLGGIEEFPESEEPEEPAYTPEEYQLAQEIKSKRLFKEQHNRPPHNAGELSYFLIKASIERPLTPDDDDLKAARRKLEAAGS
jgi:hypothetical protein